MHYIKECMRAVPPMIILASPILSFWPNHPHIHEDLKWTIVELGDIFCCCPDEITVDVPLDHGRREFDRIQMEMPVRLEIERMEVFIPTLRISIIVRLHNNTPYVMSVYKFNIDFIMFVWSIRRRLARACVQKESRNNTVCEPSR